MKKNISLVSLDPIDKRNLKQPGVIGRLFMTKRFRGKAMKKTDAFGHYLFVGAQRSGKSVSCIFMFEQLKKKYEKQGKRIVLFDNMNLGGIPIFKYSICNQIEKCVYNKDVVYIFIIDELQSWFPKDTKDQTTLQIIDQLTGQFSQLGKRQIYVLSTAQIYGRVNKNLREQCLFMVNCRPSSFRHKCVNDFIRGDDVLCDELGRWSGNPSKIWIHGLPSTRFDTHLMIKNL